MIATIIRDSPILAGAIAILVAVFLFLIIAIAGAHRKRPEEAPRRSYSRREPDFDDDSFDVDDFDRDYGPRADVRERRPERRAGRFGFGSVMVSFLLGITIGLGGLAAAPHLRVGSLMSALLGLVEAGPSTAREQAAGTAPPDEKAAVAPVPKESPKRQRMREAKAVPEPTAEPAAAAPSEGEALRGIPASPERADEREERLTKFVDRLKGEVPKPVGPTTVLATVDRKGDTVTLGYSLAGVPSELEVIQIQEALKNGVVDTFCKGKSDEARFLNDNGVAFRLLYTDKDGRTIARLTAEPRFCDSAG